MVAGLFTDGTVLLVENERMLQRIVDESEGECKRKKAESECWKVKVEREKIQVIH